MHRRRRTGSEPGEQQTQMPSMLKQDEPVNVTSNRLDYDGAARRDLHRQRTLWQGNDTTIKGDTIAARRQDRQPDRRRQGAHRHVFVVEDADAKTQATKRPCRRPARPTTFVYDDAKRLATYTGKAAHRRHRRGRHRR